MLFEPQNIPASAEVLSAPLRTNFNALVTLLNGGLTDENISAAAAIAVSKTTLAIYTPWTDWTPTVSGSTTTGSGTYTYRVGRYCQIGKTVFFSARVTLSAHTGTGYIWLSLPVASKATTGLAFIFSAVVSTVNTDGASQGINAYNVSGNNYMDFKQINDNSPATTLLLDLSTTCTLYVTGCYEVA